MVYSAAIPSWLVQTLLSLPGEGRISWGFTDTQAGSGTKINNEDIVRALGTAVAE